MQIFRRGYYIPLPAGRFLPPWGELLAEVVEDCSAVIKRNLRSAVVEVELYVVIFHGDNIPSSLIYNSPLMVVSLDNGAVFHKVARTAEHCLDYNKSLIILITKAF